MRRTATTPDVVGQYVARTVRDAEGRPLVRQGVLLTPKLVNLLRKHDIGGLWVTDEILPDLEVREAISDEGRRVASTSLRRIVDAASVGRQLSAAQVQTLTDSVTALVDAICENDDVVLNLGHLRAFDQYTYEHSLQVAVLSAIIGRDLNLPQTRLRNLALGAILHDIGKVAIPREVLLKDGVLTAEEFTVMKSHTRLGWDMLHELFSVPPTASIVTLQHHERLDGSGYPSRLKADRIYPLSRIVAVADVFDAMRADRSYRPRRTPSEVLEVFQAERGIKFDDDAVGALLGRVALVPDGEIVRLTDGSVGRVSGQNPGRPLSPRVVVVTSPEGELMAPQEVNLAAEHREVDAILNEWPKSILTHRTQGA